MGMFDTIKVKVMLPEYSSVTDEKFQTKSFNCLMQNYVITENGQLYREEWDYEWIEDETRPIIKGYIKQIEGTYRREYLTDYHGDVIFYSGENKKVMWRDYHARFTDGKLKKIWYTDTQY